MEVVFSDIGPGIPLEGRKPGSVFREFEQLLC